MKLQVIFFQKISVLLLLLFSSITFSQDFSSVDIKVKSYSSIAKPELLANQINKDFLTDSDKARAIFSWIAFNVKYDMVKYFSGASQQPVGFSYRTLEEKAQKMKQFNLEIAMQTFRSKKAVCHGYTELYNHIAALCGLESVLVPGTSKSHPTHIGQMPTIADHAWNAVKIDGKWKLLDVTWAAGGVDGNTKKFVQRFNDTYFFTNPETFFLNHFPADETMLMTAKTPAEFAALPLFYGDYFQLGIDIKTQYPGIIKQAGPLTFRIGNLATPKISYVFSSENKFHSITSIQNGNDAKFDIPIHKNQSGFLTIFVNNKSVVTYKIQRG